ncbi:MAG TPA: ester cyclase [Candidatus Bathyarchaeia archaeon]|nr:ester cyclase [Candidatus Bathyarchaeia archaeon]
MTLEAVVHDYLEGWNQHQPNSVSRLFSRDGTFQDPTLELPAKPEDLWTVMTSLVRIFPDFSFNASSIIIADSRAYVSWTMKGTAKGPWKPGIEPTNRTAHLVGVDVIENGPDGFVRVNRYYDQKSLAEQIGLQVIIEPIVQGKATYGYSKRAASGNSKAPAVFGLTWILFRDQSELDRIRTHSAQIIQDFLAEPGFISIVTGAAGNRAFTVTAWESEEALERGLNKGHAFAKQDFRTGSLSAGVWTSVWKPYRLNKLWVRCVSCSHPNDMTDNPQKCINCGSMLSDPPSYW